MSEEGAADAGRRLTHPVGALLREPLRTVDEIPVYAMSAPSSAVQPVALIVRAQ
jgi:hypothetical protein